MSYLALVELVLFDGGDLEDAFKELPMGMEVNDVEEEEVIFEETVLAVLIIGIFDADDVEDVPIILVEIDVADGTMGVIWFGAGDAVL